MDNRRLSLLMLLIAAIGLIAGCTRALNTPKPQEGTHPVDPVFQDFYKAHGGRNVLGPAISPPFTPESDQDKIYQYLVSGLLMYDRRAQEGLRVSLAPIGRDMHVYELPEVGQSVEGERLENGHPVYEKFIPLYEMLGGSAVVGRPLTGVHKNVAKQRFEQYFENLGFYWLEGDQEDAVHLLAYGAWKCGRMCAQPIGGGRIDTPYQSVPQFVEKVAQLGLEFTGPALSQPVIQGGQVQQVYQNVILTTDQLNPDDVRLFPLPEVVGKSREDPRPPSPAPDMEFYAVEDTLGYNVHKAFSAYILDHGGFNFVGNPITHAARLDPSTLEQCFTGVCLRGQLEPDGDMAVSVLPLGLDYLRLMETGVESLTDVTMQVDETYPMISSDQAQELWVVVSSAGVPVANVEPELTLTLPDGTQQIYRMPATDQDGESRQTIPPFMAANGTLVPYVICVQLQNQQRFCVGDSYLIWPVPTIQVTPTLPPVTYNYLPYVVKNATFYIPAFMDRFVTYLPFLGNQR